MRIGLTSIFVDDQDQAEQFYTQVLGFQVKTNTSYGPNERWLSVASAQGKWRIVSKSRRASGGKGTALSVMTYGYPARRASRPILNSRHW